MDYSDLPFDPRDPDKGGDIFAPADDLSDEQIRKVNDAFMYELKAKAGTLSSDPGASRLMAAHTEVTAHKRMNYGLTGVRMYYPKEPPRY
jgi:hypothetical protein